MFSPSFVLINKILRQGTLRVSSCHPSRQTCARCRLTDGNRTDNKTATRDKRQIIQDWFHMPVQITLKTILIEMCIYSSYCTLQTTQILLLFFSQSYTWTHRDGRQREAARERKQRRGAEKRLSVVFIHFVKYKRDGEREKKRWQSERSRRRGRKEKRLSVEFMRFWITSHCIFFCCFCNAAHVIFMLSRF